MLDENNKLKGQKGEKIGQKLGEKKKEKKINQVLVPHG